MRRTFNVRFSDQELQQLKIAASARGWSVGRYIRFRTLGQDKDQEDRIQSLERQVTKLKGGKA